MQLEGYLCLDGLELSNHYRMATYITDAGLASTTMNVSCACIALADDFTSIAADPAPWYESTRPDSEEFFGFWANAIQLSDVYSRTVTPTSRTGSALSPLAARGRVVTVEGIMVASSALGMAYGERWLSEGLRDDDCGEGCLLGDLEVLPACPEDQYDTDYFRSLMNVGVVDGPLFAPADSGVPQCYVQAASFSLASSVPWLAHPKTRCVDEEPLPAYDEAPITCSLTTPGWMGDGTFVIDIINADTIASENIVITGQLSLDGSCPDDNFVPPTWEYTIPSLEPGARIVIDGIRRRLLYYDASYGQPVSALSYIDFEGGWSWPDVGVCQTMCLTITSAAGNATATVDTYLREM